MALEQAGVQFVAIGGDQYITTLNSATKSTHSFVDATESGGGKVSAAGQIMTGALRQIGTIAIDAFAQAAKATVGFIKDSVGLAGEFESGMLNFQSVAGKDVDTAGLEKFRDLFLDIGKRLPVSTSEVQKAATEMVKGGIDPAALAAGALEQNIQFAAAAMEGDLVKAAEISSKILGGWTSASDDAATKSAFLTHSTDLLTKAANASATDVEGLSRGIFNAQGIAKTAGVSFDDLTTTLAELAPRFASSSEAGNSLKNMIARLQPTTKTAAGYMLDLGLITEDGGNKFYDAQGKFVGFQQASDILKTSLVGLTEQQKAMYLQQIFGNDAMTSAAALAEMGGEGYAAMAEALGKANGVMDAAALKQQGFETSLDNAKGSVEALQITIGSALLPVLSDLLDNVIAPAVNTLTDFASAIFGSDEAMSRLSPTMQDIVHVIDVVVADVQEIIGAFDDAGAMSSEFGESIGLLAKDLGLPGELIQDIVFAVQDLVKWFSTASDESNSLGTVVDDLSGIWDHAGDVVADVMHAYQAIAQAVLPIVAGFIDEHGEDIKTFFQTTWNQIVEIVNLALDVYDSIVPPVLNAIAGFIEEHGSEIQKIFGGVWEMVTNIVTGALETIKGVIKLVLDIIHGDWNAAWEDIKHIIDAQATAIGGIVSGFLDAVAGIFDTSLDEILQTWEDSWNMAVDIVSDIDWSSIGSDVIAGIVSGVESASGQLMSTLKNLASDALQAAKDALGISSPSKEFAAVGQFAVEGIMQGMSDRWPALTTLVGKLSKDLIDDMESIGQDMQNAIANGFGAEASIDRQIAKNLDSFKDVLPEYASYTQGALKEAQDQASAMLDPAEGAKFFKMRSDQILEYAKLQKELAEAETAEDRQRIQAQMLLINKAQTAEINEFQSNAQAQQGATDKIADSINAVMAALAGVHLTDDQIKIVDMLATIWDQISSPITSRQQQYANPPMLPSQYGAPTSTSYSQQSNYNMPIYTNQSPAVLQQSWAIMQASMP